MSTEGNDNNIYSAEDIARYHTGEMSDREMYDLEKAALEDPFLADALEGFENRSTAQVKEEMNVLKDRLTKRIEEKKRRTIFPFYRVGIAAAVFLLAGSLSVVYFLNKAEEQQRQVLVQETPSVPKYKTESPGADSITPAPEMQSAKTRQLTKKESPKQQVFVEPVPKETEELKSFSPVASSPSLASRRSFDTVQNRESSMAMADLNKAEKIPELKKPDTLASLQEVVVVGYGVQKKTTVTGSVSTMGNISVPKISISPFGIAEDKADFNPVEGWKAFTAYFQKSVSQKIGWQKKNGEIIIGFSIDDSGFARDLRVEKSPDQTLDREIIRIIDKGPKWKIIGEAGRLVRISVNFQIP